VDVKAGPQRGEVKLEQLKQALYEAKELGLKRFKITGGEPFIRKKLVNQLVEIGSELDLTVYIETNGTLINEEEAKFLKGRAVGISISLDFPDERHEEFRRLRGSFKRVLKTIELLSEHEVSWMCIMTITRSNFAEIPALAKLVIPLGARVLKVHPCLALGRAKGLEELLAPLECLKLIRIVAQLDEIYKGKIITTMPLSLVASFFDWPRPLRIGGVCPYKNLLSILPNGDIALCGIGMTHPETVFGNIYQSSISEIWNKATGYLKELRSTTPNSFNGICSRCTFNKHCANSCPAYVYESSGTFFASHPLCEALYKMGLFPEEYLTDEQRQEGDKPLNVWEAARYLSFPVDVVYEMLEEGELPGKKVEGRWRIDIEELEQWLDEEVTQEELDRLAKRLQID